MCCIRREINCRQSARKQHLAVVPYAFLFAAPLQPRTCAQQGGASGVKKRDLSAGGQATNIILVGVGAEKNEARQEHHDANAHEPIRPKPHLERTFGFLCGCLSC